jgi:hypothetical protein
VPTRLEEFYGPLVPRYGLFRARPADGIRRMLRSRIM